jgi:DNA-binding MarR family transcriptional regulator
MMRMPGNSSAARKVAAKPKRALATGKPSTRSPCVIAGLDVSLLENSVGYNLRRAQSRQMQRFRAVFGKLEVRPVQLSILTIILQNSEVRQASLGRALDMKRANVVTVLDELERKGLLARRPATADRRSYVLDLTPAGRKLAQKLVELHEKFEEDLEKAFGKAGREDLLAMLHRIRALDPEPHID